MKVLKQRLKKKKADVVIPDLLNIYENGAMKEAGDELCNLRKILGHKIDRSTLSDQKSKKLAEAALEYFSSLFESLLFFHSISFGYISAIEVKKEKYDEPKFLYKGTLGTDFNLKSFYRLETLDFFKETDSVVIRFEEKSNYLNLFPFFIFYTKEPMPADIFYFNGIEGKKFEYISVSGNAGQMKIAKDSPQIKQKLSIMEILNNTENYIDSNDENLYYKIENEFNRLLEIFI